MLGTPAVVAALAHRVPQQQAQQQQDDHQPAHARAQQPLAPLGGGDLQRGQLLFRFQQRDLLFLQAGVEFHLQVGQAALACIAVGNRRGLHAGPEMGQGRDQMAAPLRQPRTQLLGFGDGQVGFLGAVVLQGAVEQRIHPVQVQVQFDQALGQHQARTPHAGGEARRLELLDRLPRPLQGLAVAALLGRHLAHAVLAVGDEHRVAGARAGLDLAAAPGLRLGIAAGMVLGQG